MSSEAPTYNSAFPALNASGLMNVQNRQSIQQGSSALYRAIHHPLAPPKIPSYLKQTKYAALVLEQYNYQQNKYHLKPISGLTQPLPKTSPLEDEELEQLDLRLPTFWNSKDKSKNIDVGTNGLDLSYCGPGQKESDAALVRANFPMRPQCGIFYFEMKVISKGNDGYIGIGFCCASNKLERLPGWDLESWGYHGDDGHSFGGSGTGKNYGPCFTTGDVIGCGVDFSNNSAFYTKNGRHLGIAFKDMVIDKPVYPAIGLRTPGEQVTANFGHEPFVFDIEQYIKDQKIRVIEDITKSPTANKYFDSNTVVKSQDRDMYSKEVMDQLVLSYLIHHGYTGTAKAVVQNAGHVSGQELFLSDAHNEISQQGEQDMEERHIIRSAIVKGKIDEAIKLINKYFPGVLQEEGRGQELQLWLKCGRFVEMMRECCNKGKRSGSLPRLENGNGLVRSRKYSSDDLKGGMQEGGENKKSRSDSPTALSPTTSVNSPIPTIGALRERRLSYAEMAASLSPSSSTELPKTYSSKEPHCDTEMMDIDSSNDGSHSIYGNVWTRRTSASSSATNSLVSTDNNSTEDENGNNIETAESLKHVMEYGQKLQEEYRHDTRDKTRSCLVEIFSLLAYRDPDNSPVAYLMDISRRDALATEVNAAILAFQNRPEMPSVERIYRQVSLANKELIYKGNGMAPLIDTEEYCASATNTFNFIS